MIRLFRRKMIFVIKYFRRNHFQKKIMFSKIFSSVWFARKNYEMRKSEFAKYCRNRATSTGRCWIPTSKFGWIRPKWPDSSGLQIQPDPSHFVQIRLDQWPDPTRACQIRLTSDHGRNPAIF
jgi:hypothetical protein